MFQKEDYTNLVAQLQEHLARDPTHLANVLAGPKREEWFNAEAFTVASTLGPTVCQGRLAFYGEQSFRTVLSLLGEDVSSANDVVRKADLIGFWAEEEDAPPAVVIEQKLIYSQEPNKGASTIRSLVSQLGNAAEHLKVPVLGILYCAKSPGTWGGDFTGRKPADFYQAVWAAINEIIIEPGHAVGFETPTERQVIDGESTSFVYPACFFSMGIATVVRWPVTTE